MAVMKLLDMWKYNKKSVKIPSAAMQEYANTAGAIIMAYKSARNKAGYHAQKN